ncbi:MAG TPA: 4a-hydroxytetrahydrobiopterin dehydratase [Thermoanaerobaculia bacterium]|jgi:pterin-4a-carbinolamine dehydratase
MQQFVIVQAESRLRRVVRPFFRKLKPERAQEELRTMPGWSMLPNGKVIQRTYQFTSDRTAANYATYFAAHAGDTGQPAILNLTGRTLTVKLFAPQYRGRYAALDVGVIAFARQLN